MVWVSLPHSDSCIPNNLKLMTPGPSVILIRDCFLSHTQLTARHSIPNLLYIFFSSVLFTFGIVFYTGSIISVWGLKLLVHEALRYQCVRTQADCPPTNTTLSRTDSASPPRAPVSISVWVCVCVREGERASERVARPPRQARHCQTRILVGFFHCLLSLQKLKNLLRPNEAKAWREIIPKQGTLREVWTSCAGDGSYPWRHAVGRACGW